MRVWDLPRGRLGPLLLDLLFPPVCLGCGGAIVVADTARLVCRLCRSRLKPPAPPLCPRCGAPRRRTGAEPGPVCSLCSDWPPSLRCARTACLLQPPSDRLVHQLKYNGWKALAGPMAERMRTVRFPLDVEREVSVVTAVPTTSRRRVRRGYNQAEELGRAYAAGAGRRFEMLLARGGSATTQTALQAAERAANVAGAFGVVPGAAPLIRGRHVLLVDDVLTTGATVAECAATLTAAGARCVSALAFARALA